MYIPRPQLPKSTCVEELPEKVVKFSKVLCIAMIAKLTAVSNVRQYETDHRTE